MVRPQSPTLPSPIVPSPIFIVGLARRTGTNFLSDLLALHPDCVTAAPVHEDYLLLRAGALRGYVDAVVSSWPSAWDVPGTARAELLRSIGDGIIRFLQDGNDARVVTKSPHVENLDLFFELFPDSCLLIAVRDGRNVVESTVRSFAMNEEKARREWAAAARTVLDFDARHRGGPGRYRIVRYENLVDGLRTEMRCVLDLCGLDPARYDFDAAEQLPVRGSSDLAMGGDGVHWQPVARDPGFDPNARSRSWTSYERVRFAEVAGAEQRALGYDVDPPVGVGAAGWFQGRVDDTTWWLRRVRRRLRSLRTRH